MGESRYGFSEEDDLIESILDELIAAREAKDFKHFMASLKTIIQLIKNKEDSHGADSLENA